MSRFALNTGRRYLATLRLGFFERGVANGTIAAKFEAAGLSNVHVVGSGRDRSGQGDWFGPPVDVELPEQVTSVQDAGEATT